MTELLGTVKRRAEDNKRLQRTRNKFRGAEAQPLAVREHVVRTAKDQDAEAACHVLRRSIAECCIEDHKNDPLVLQNWLENKTPENVRAWFQNAGSFAVVLEAAGKIAGVALMSKTGEVALCYLVPEARFIGAGKALLSSMETEAIRRGLDTLQLESTATAQAFYRRNGFVSYGEPRRAFEITAFPMRKKLSTHATHGNDG